MPRIEFQDQGVIYQSPSDGDWIAHSLQTDQIGYGQSIVEALADAIKAVDQVCRAAEQDETPAYLRPAPPEVRGLFDNAMNSVSWK